MASFDWTYQEWQGMALNDVDAGRRGWSPTGHRLPLVEGPFVYWRRWRSGSLNSQERPTGGPEGGVSANPVGDGEELDDAEVLRACQQVERPTGGPEGGVSANPVGDGDLLTDAEALRVCQQVERGGRRGVADMRALLSAAGISTTPSEVSAEGDDKSTRIVTEGNLWRMSQTYGEENVGEWAEMGSGEEPCGRIDGAEMDTA